MTCEAHLMAEAVGDEIEPCWEAAEQKWEGTEFLLCSGCHEALGFMVSLGGRCS